MSSTAGPGWLARVALLLLAALAFAAPVRAQLTIEIIGGGGTTIPVAIVPFDGESNFPLGITGIVGADLTRSGLFKLVDYAGVVPRPVRAEDVRAADWRAKGADAVVVGTMRPLARRPRRGPLRAGRRGRSRPRWRRTRTPSRRPSSAPPPTPSPTSSTSG